MTVETSQENAPTLSEAPAVVMARYFGPSVHGFHVPFPKKPETLPSGEAAAAEAFADMRDELTEIASRLRVLTAVKDDLSLKSKREIAHARHHYGRVTANRIGLALALLPLPEVTEKVTHGRLMLNAVNGLMPTYKALRKLSKAMRRLDEQRQLVSLLHHSTTDHGGEEIFNSDIVNGAKGLSKAVHTILDWSKKIALPQGMEQTHLGQLLEVPVPDPVTRPQELPKACRELLKRFYGARAMVLSRVARVGESVEAAYGFQPQVS
ncbi:MAG: hypothetical protein QNK37_15000 [Acidobacteriota bacterium]|nr:hypothetical protein [Acidobacteriota bacterium]